MRVLVFSKRSGGLAGRLASELRARGCGVDVVGLRSLAVDDRLGAYDVVVLKSKHLFFIYGALLALDAGAAVVPDPELARVVHNRLEFPRLAAAAGIRTPRHVVGFPAALKRALGPDRFPMVVKGIVGGHARGVRVLRSPADLPDEPDAGERFVYLEEHVEGEHLLVYFVEEDVRAFLKPPFGSEHADAREVAVEPDVEAAVAAWKRATGLEFGHLDLVRERCTGELVLVDPGAFPQFVHWPGVERRLAYLILRAAARRG
ncbi:MAG: hypothetical protein Kow0069_35210 [Promethearchaeota archaeon]